MTDIQLSEEDRAFIEERVRSGPYKTVNDVVHADFGNLNVMRRLSSNLFKRVRMTSQLGAFMSLVKTTI